jgi:hypothetical protein
MAMEHQPSGPPQVGAITGDLDSAARALRIQILATEHWSLLATRSLSWNESFARAGMFLTLLSGATVALALVAQATAFGQGFAVFALLILPVVLFVGLATYVRLLEINNEDYVWVRGMNRLRGAYLAIDPELAQYFITGSTEDAVGIFKTYGAHEASERSLDTGRFHGLVTTPTTIAFVDATLAAVLAAVAVTQLGMVMVPAAGIGVLTFFVAAVALALFGYRSQEMAHLAPTALASIREARGDNAQEGSP